MTTRNDVDVEFFSSPRVAEVRAPSTEIIMQDLVDTMRIQEETFRGMSFDKLINASGKEDLGGGVKVGITVAMQNLLLAFAGRTTPAESGTVTSSLAPTVANQQRFEDTAADFITAGVQRGSLLINFTDQSVADVVEVESATVLRTKTLVEGIGNTYDVADVYKVWNIVQVSATGGNLVAVDEVQSVIAAILPTAFTQVVLTSSASATLQEQADIQFSSYNGYAYVDPSSANSSPSLAFPSGTRRQPAETLSQALTIANDVGLQRIFLGPGVFSVPIGPDFGGKIFEGESTGLTDLTVPSAATVDDCKYERMTIDGTLDGESQINQCEIGTLAYVNGIIFESGLTGVITLGGTAQASLIDCFSLVAGAATPEIDMGVSGQSLVMRGYKGGIEISNKTGSDMVSIDMDSGQINVNDTVTTGDIYLRGTAKWTNRDTYAGGANVVDELVDGKELSIMRKIMRNKMVTDPVTGIMTIFDDDGTTVLISGNIYENTLLTQAYRGRGLEVRNRLE